MKHIGNLEYAEGSKKKRKRIGRGAGSGHGGTSTRGHKGHQSRTGYNQSKGFEGGQMPLHRRLPKFGFTNPFRVEYQVINVGMLDDLIKRQVITTDQITPELLFELRIVNNKRMPIKILGNGEISAKLQVTADKFTESAKQKIESAGGTVITNE